MRRFLAGDTEGVCSGKGGGVVIDSAGEIEVGEDSSGFGEGVSNEDS